MKLKIPPALVFIISTILMYLLSSYFPIIDVYALLVGVGLVLLGAYIAILGVYSFRKAKTTVNPLHPEKSSTIVSSGIYRFTRNPMYLGMSVALLGMTFIFGDISAILGVIGFVLYINYFQIIPEEKILKSNFGKVYEEYCVKTRRWI